MKAGIAKFALVNCAAILIARYVALARSWHDSKPTDSEIFKSKLLLQDFAKAIDDIWQLLFNICSELFSFRWRGANGFDSHIYCSNYEYGYIRSFDESTIKTVKKVISIKMLTG